MSSQGSERQPGRYVRSVRGDRTFLPEPLPPKVQLAPETQRVVERATHLLGQVEMCRRLLPNADLLVYSSLQREALASSTIEGTVASPDELVLFQASQRTEREAVREVANYAAALQWGCELLSQRPIATVLILGLHGILLQGVRGAESVGRFKDLQNWIGSRPGEAIEAAVFVPAAPEHTPDLIQRLEEYINGENDEARVVQCALVHYQFETIHPFRDGNGRVGRLLIVLQLIALGLLSAPLIHPSVYFERRRQEYYQKLQDVRDRGAWNEWIAFFGEGIAQQSQETIDFARTILDLQEHLHTNIANVRRRAALREVLGAFFVTPVLTIGQISTMAHMARNSAQAAVEELQALEIVREITGRQKGRVYACQPVLEAVFRPVSPPDDEREKAGAAEPGGASEAETDSVGT